jgi:site-specific DNA-methyltransferase (adenine-specific)
MLPGLLKSAPKFDLIYAYPPFNAGGTRRARLQRGERSQGTRVYRDHWGGLAGFLEMMEPRIRLLHDALSERGSLWLHLDQRTVHDVKVLCDGIFARGTFQGEIIWVPGNGSRSKHAPPMTHQTLLVYSRGPRMIWNHEDPVLREAYADTSLRMHFTREDAAGRRFRDRTIAGKTYRYYADEGRQLGSVWTDCPAMSANTPLTRETTGYPTQKPLKLLERIVCAASLPGSRVLDPMCGSGTTVVAAAKHGREALGIDLSPVACKIAKQRLADL